MIMLQDFAVSMATNRLHTFVVAATWPPPRPRRRALIGRIVLDVDIARL
jgi:hypothetical protein